MPDGFIQGTHYAGKTGKMAKQIPCHGKQRDVSKFCQNTGILVCSSCKFPDSKGKYILILAMNDEDFQISFEAL